MTAQISNDVLAALQERKRNALVAVAIALPAAPCPDEDTLCQYLLMDVWISARVMGTRVSGMIASLQQYITRIISGIEPGYEAIHWLDGGPNQKHLLTYEKIYSNYADWAGNQELTNYPANYLSPPLRTDVTHNFQTLINNLEQGALTGPNIQTAVLQYLSDFETTANLKIISGYAANSATQDFSQATYYLLGRTRQPVYNYYVRSLDMTLASGGIIPPNAWSDWQSVNLPLDTFHVVGTPRPVVFNSRLYVVWFERSFAGLTTEAPESTLSIRLAWRKTDGSWSSPVDVGKVTGTLNTLEPATLTSLSAGVSVGGVTSCTILARQSRATYSTLAFEYLSPGTGDSSLYAMLSLGNSSLENSALKAGAYIIVALDKQLNAANPDTIDLALLSAYAGQTASDNMLNNGSLYLNPTGKDYAGAADITGQNLIQGSISGSTISCSGTFSWTQASQSGGGYGALPAALTGATSTTYQGNGVVLTSDSVTTDTTLLVEVDAVKNSAPALSSAGAPKDAALVTSLMGSGSVTVIYDSTQGKYLVNGQITAVDMDPEINKIRLSIRSGDGSYLSYVEPTISGKTSVFTNKYSDSLDDMSLSPAEGGSLKAGQVNFQFSDSSSFFYSGSSVQYATAQATSSTLELQYGPDDTNIGKPSRSSTSVMTSASSATANLQHTWPGVSFPHAGSFSRTIYLYIYQDYEYILPAPTGGSPVSVGDAGTAWCSYKCSPQVVVSAPLGQEEFGIRTTQNGYNNGSLSLGTASMPTFRAFVAATGGYHSNAVVLSYYSSSYPYGLYVQFKPGFDSNLIPVPAGKYAQYQLQLQLDYNGGNPGSPTPTQPGNHFPTSSSLAPTFDESTLVQYNFNNQGEKGNIYYLIIQYLYDNSDYTGTSTTNFIAWDIQVQQTKSVSGINFPWLDTNTDSTGTVPGIAEYLHFSPRDVNSSYLPPTRLNTLFTDTLITQAQQGVEFVFGNWALQNTPEPALDGNGSTPMDFYGANGLTFWELFYHLPMYIVWKLAAQGRYAEALAWIRFVFNPAAINGTWTGGSLPDYWRVVPLLDADGQAYHPPMEYDAWAEAYANPSIFRQATYYGYVELLISLGDTFYRTLTTDSLNMARMCYNLAGRLLGVPATTQAVDLYESLTMHKAATNIASAPNNENGLPDGFFLTSNSQQLALDKRIASRQYNLNNNLDINGKPISIPLYATPTNPSQLLAQESQGNSASGRGNSFNTPIPPYSYTAISARATNAVQTLISVGEQVQAALRGQDDAGQAELQIQQAVALGSLTLNLAQQNLQIEQLTLEALQLSLQKAQDTYSYYDTQIKNGVSSTEQSAMDALTTAGALRASAPALVVAGAALDLAPNIFGLADGGDKWGASLIGSSHVLEISATISETTGARLQTSAQYSRRNDEWTFARDQAQDDINVLNQQVTVQQARITAAQLQVQVTQMQIQQQQAMQQYILGRFTNQAFYQWLLGQLSGLYYQLYDLTLTLCLMAQASWNFEMPDNNSSFIPTGAWDDNYHGLTAGQSLLLGLEQMDLALLQRNERRLNIVRTVSLREYWDKVKTAAFAAWDGDGGALESLRSTGTLDFVLPEALFDGDFPGHYLRQIAEIEVSLPVIVGPYQNVRATLVQTRNALACAPSLDAVTYLNEGSGSGASGTDVKTNLRASQKVVLSTGQHDNGVLPLYAGDGRYGPFERTGAVSSWTLAFPNSSSDEQQAILKSLSDVIVKISYTAKNGGKGFASQVQSYYASKSPLNTPA
ncbi:Tc toxin subunit A-related protein [Pseudomonas chlororaphis]|uniref:Tc toxin subunit A-related protein n=1 Tax=Pseudomonas chlororaphis TaxID=587753 RepID=UPI000BE23D87|nr:neuraminidase-like domain-containing protein [Pseudomonas chlororaphis]